MGRGSVDWVKGIGVLAVDGVGRADRTEGRAVRARLGKAWMDLARKRNNEVTRCCVTRLSKAGVRSDHVCHDAWI